jgi:hypothetical protein
MPLPLLLPSTAVQPPTRLRLFLIISLCKMQKRLAGPRRNWWKIPEEQTSQVSRVYSTYVFSAGQLDFFLPGCGISSIPTVFIHTWCRLGGGGVGGWEARWCRPGKRFRRCRLKWCKVGDTRCMVQARRCRLAVQIRQYRLSDTSEGVKAKKTWGGGCVIYVLLFTSIMV